MNPIRNKSLEINVDTQREDIWHILLYKQQRVQDEHETPPCSKSTLNTGCIRACQHGEQ